MYGLIGLAVSFSLSYMNKGTNQSVGRNAEGFVELRMNKFYQILGYVVLGLGFIILLVIIYYQEKEMTLIGALAILFVVGLGLPVLLYYRNHKVYFNEETVTVISWTGKKQVIRWEEIQKISFNAFSGYLKLFGLANKVKMHQHLVGLKEFIKMMEEKTNWTAKSIGFSQMLK